MRGSIIGVGCDVVSISRIAKLIDNPQFLAKVYTDLEQDYISKKGLQSAAGFWAAKEAVAKALGCGFVGFGASDIELRHTSTNAPFAVLYNGADARFNSLEAHAIHISISHEKDQALAFAVLE